MFASIYKQDYKDYQGVSPRYGLKGDGMDSVGLAETQGKRYNCSICGASWKPKKRDGLPQRCPRCKSKMWSNSYKHHCAKCGYDWISAFPSPDRCPGCQSRKWRRYEKEAEEIPQSYLSKEVKIPILLRYDAGMGCVKISIDLNQTFSAVYDVIKETYPENVVRL
jgi:predicted Zn-ribbon and HTH transcriptional regulator